MKFCRTTIVVTMTFTILLAQDDFVFAKKPKLDLGLGIGYRIDKLDWNIAAVTPSLVPVNVGSELTWDDLNIVQVKVSDRLIVETPTSRLSIYQRAFIDFGHIVDGNNQDSDFLGNNRTSEFSRSNNDSDAGNVFDASIGAGIQFKTKLKNSSLAIGIAPLIGFSYREQNLKMINGFQTVATPGVTPPIGPISGLNSTYDTEWNGPWVGIDISMEANQRAVLYGSFEYHWTDYHAEANWNLRTDFQHPVSFTHDANGSGMVASLGGEYRFSPLLTFNISIEYLKWSTDRGIDRTFFSDGTVGFACLNSDRSLRIDCLNEVNWESQSLTLGIVYRFK